jgi:hypothetical protein
LIEELKGLEFRISRHERGSDEFMVKFNKSSIRDLVFSSSRAAIAVAMSASEWKEALMALVTVDASGKRRVFEYQSHQMTERFGWVVELGAVSDNGSLVLAKCAMLMPEVNGMRPVNHRWTILSVVDGSIRVVESEDGIEKWTKLSRPHRVEPDRK